MQATYQEIKFSDADVVNPDDFIPAGEYNPHNVRPWLLHDHGFPVAVVFADCLQDALDEAADSGKLNRYHLEESDPSVRADYMELIPDEDGEPYWEFKDGSGVSYLGDSSDPFDIESLGYVELPNPRFSFVALFNAHKA